MQSDIRLFIGGKEAYFSADPKILFNCKETELRNPTIVKNTWTKSVSLPSCQANNDIFNQFWKLDRVQGGGTFNAMLKTPFELYLNGSLIQNGYCKLDSVKISNGNSEYQVTLFGGLGDFFYNLSYWENGNTNTKKSLASLNYADGYDDIWGEEPNLDITINKETVKEAWDALLGGGSVTPDDKWDVINFAPCYNGIPSDFDANKVLIAGNSFISFFPGYSASTTVDGDEYSSIFNGSKNYSGYCLAETSEALTCDETLDFRSYLQRPVVNVYRTILACCNPANNGGYQVKLDPHFFHYDNPYYYGRNAWMTLPMLRDLGVEGGDEEPISGATVIDSTRNVKVVNYTAPTLSQVNNIRMRVNVGLSTDATGDTLYTYFNYHSNATTLNTNIVRDMKMNEGLCVMLVGRDDTGRIAAQSTESYCLSSYQFDPVTWKNVYEGFSVEGYPEPRGMRFVYGMWRKMSGQWVFTDLMGRQVDLEFTFNNTLSLSSLELVVQIKGGESVVKKVLGRKDWQEHPDEATLTLWKSMGATDNENRLASGVKSAYAYTGVTPVYNITEFSAIATDYEAFFSNSFISREKMLSTSFTPAEFLISYCKLFGLYFYRDPAEVADNELLFPKGVIHIMDRDTFYTGEYVDLEDRIDHSRDMAITPAMAASKWYSFDLDPVESEAQKAYQTTYGYNYGRQLVNTGYNFDEGTTNLYDGNVFKGGIMVREKDKYFVQPIGDIPQYTWNGLTYQLFRPGSDEYQSTEIRIEPKSIAVRPCMNTLGLRNYDLMPKLQCHSEKNEAVEGDGVLLFFNGAVNPRGEFGPIKYWLTDDVSDMQFLNDGQPCWLMIGDEYICGQRVGIQVDRLPLFTRDIIINGQEGNIIHSWNFGHPQVTFSPNTYTTDGDSVYDKCWKDYIGDLYSVDTKKLTCYVKLDGRPSNEWLRKWYFFDNSVWRLNEIKDWNICGLDTVQCEFIKVKDVDNYHLEEISTEGFEALTANPDTIPISGGVVTFTVRLQSGGNWFLSDNIGGTDTFGNNYYLISSEVASATRGSGETSTFTVTFPENVSGGEITWRIGVEDDWDNWLWAEVTQLGAECGEFNINPANLVFGYELGEAQRIYVTSCVPWEITQLSDGPYEGGGDESGDTSGYTFTVYPESEKTPSSASTYVWYGVTLQNVSGFGVTVAQGDWIDHVELDYSDTGGYTLLAYVYFNGQNSGSTVRTATLVFSGATGEGDVSATRTIRQAKGAGGGGDLTIAVVPSAQTIASSTTAATMDYTMPSMYSTSTIGVSVDASWAQVTVDRNLERVTLTCPQNSTYTARTATVTITGTSSGQVVRGIATVTQQGAVAPVVSNLSISPASLQFGYESNEQKNVQVTSNKPWEITEITDL